VAGAFVIQNAAELIQTSGGLTVAGLTTIDPGAAVTVTLMSATNDFATVSIGNANPVTLRDADGITLGTCGPTTDLSVTAAGTIDQSGVVTVPGTASFAPGAGNSVVLNTQSNHFATVIVTNGADAFFLDADGIVLGAVTISGNLSVTASGAITQTGILTVLGTADFSAGANSVTLDLGNDFGGTVSVTNSGTASTEIVDTDDLILGNLSVGTGTLTVTANGITQFASTTVVQAAAAGAAAFDGGTGVVTLDQTGNDFTGEVTLSNSDADNVIITDTNGLTVAGASVTGALTISAGGNLVLGSTGPIACAGTFSAAASAGNITVSNTIDSGTGSVTLNPAAGTIYLSYAGTAVQTNGGDVTFSRPVVLQQTATVDTDAAGGTTAAGGVAFADMVDAETADTQGLFIDASADGGGAGGAVSFGAAAGTTRLASLSVTTNAAAADAIRLQDVTTDGPQSYGAPVTVTASAVLDSSNGDGAVTFSGAVNALTAGVQSITVNAGAGLVSFGGGIGTTTAFSSVTVETTAASAAAITLRNVDSRGTQHFGGNVTLAVSALLDATDGGAFAAGGPVQITGAVNAAAAGTQSLTVEAGVGAVAIGGNMGTSTALAAIDISSTAAAAAAITIRSADTRGAQTYNGNVTLGADTVLDSTDGGANAAGAAINLAGTVNGTTAGQESLTITAADGTVTLGGAIGGSTSLQFLTVATTAPLALPAVTLNTGGNLDVTTGALTQTGALTVPGTTTIDTGANAITLTNPGNSFTGSVSLSNSGAANDVALNAASALILGGVTTGGDLIVETTDVGGISDSGNVAVTGNSFFTAPNASSIVLDSTGNTFTGGVSFIAAAGNLTTVTVYDTTAIDLGPLALTAATGTLIVTSEAGITQAGGALSGGSLTAKTLNAAAIDLSNAGNDFDTIDIRVRDATDSAYAAGAISYADSDGFNINAAVGSTGEITLNAVAGTVTQTGGPILGGGSLELLGGADFTLTQTTNEAAELAAVVTGALSYTDATALSINAVGSSIGIDTGTAALTIIAGAGGGGALSIDQSVSAGTIQFTGVGISLASGITVDAGSATILLDGNDGNILLSDGTLTTTSAASPAVTLRDAALLTLGNVTTGASGTLVLGQASPAHISGNITQTASTALSVGTVTVVSGGSVTLNESGNAIGTVGSVSRGGAVSITDGTDAMIVAGPMNLGATTNTVTLSAAGLLTLSATAAVSATGVGSVSLSGLGVTNSGAAIAGAAGVSIDAGTGTFSNSGSGSVSSTNAAITIIADDLTLTAVTSSISSGTGGVPIVPASTVSPTARVIDIGTDTVGRLGLTDAELDTISVTDPGILLIGDAAHDGQIIVTAASAPANAPNLTLVNRNDGIDIRADLTASNDLVVRADGAGAEAVGAVTRSTGPGSCPPRRET
jgi:hypothetical protein